MFQADHVFRLKIAFLRDELFQGDFFLLRIAFATDVMFQSDFFPFGDRFSTDEMFQAHKNIPFGNRCQTHGLFQGSKRFHLGIAFSPPWIVSGRLLSFWGSFFYRWNVSGANKYSSWESLSNSWVVPRTRAPQIALGIRFFTAMNCSRATFFLLRIAFSTDELIISGTPHIVFRLRIAFLKFNQAWIVPSAPKYSILAIFFLQRWVFFSGAQKYSIFGSFIRRTVHTR